MEQRTLYVKFIRHAEGQHMLNSHLIVGRSIEAQLTDKGVKDAVTKGQALLEKGENFDYVASSSAIRCIQTGQNILAGMKKPKKIEVTEELLEMDQGTFVGRVRDEVYNEAVLNEIKILGKDFALKGGESMNQVGARGLAWLENFERKFHGSSISALAIAHAGLITYTIGLIEDWDQPKSLQMLKTMAPLAETQLRFSDNQWTVEYFAR